VGVVHPKVVLEQKMNQIVECAKHFQIVSICGLMGGLGLLT
jgi:hypothetical protein